jgi:hypothetical protein
LDITRSIIDVKSDKLSSRNAQASKSAANEGKKKKVSPVSQKNVMKI